MSYCPFSHALDSGHGTTNLHNAVLIILMLNMNLFARYSVILPKS